MAKENTAHLFGQIEADPIIKIKPTTGEAASAYLVLKCIRRPYVPGEGYVGSRGDQRIDFVPIITTNPNVIKQCYELRKNDIISVKGVVTTRNVKKTYTCPNGHKFSQIGTKGYITPIFISLRYKGAKVVSEEELPDGQIKKVYSEGVTPESGLEILTANCEISNQLYLIGTLVRDPITHIINEQTGKCVTQYQLATNRRYHIPDPRNEDKTDYPWVKTINKQGNIDFENLRQGSVVMINGAIQSRDVERTAKCDVCEAEVKVTERVIELFPYSVEYLRDCFNGKLRRKKAEGEEGLNDASESNAEDVSARKFYLPIDSPPPVNQDTVKLAVGKIKKKPIKKSKPVVRNDVVSVERPQLAATAVKAPTASNDDLLVNVGGPSLFSSYWGAQPESASLVAPAQKAPSTPAPPKAEEEFVELLDNDADALGDAEDDGGFFIDDGSPSLFTN